jgi:hypothetical protein
MSKKIIMTNTLTTQQIIADLIDEKSTPIVIQQEAGKRLQELLELIPKPIEVDFEPVILSAQDEALAIANEKAREEQYLKLVQIPEIEE